MKAKFTYSGIRVRDLEKSVHFYTQVLGMRETGRSTIEQAKGTVVALTNEEGGHVLELNYYEKGSRFDTEYVVGEGIDHLAFQVGDLDQAVKEAAKAGFPVVLDMNGTVSRWVYIQDPNGIFIELFS